MIILLSEGGTRMSRKKRTTYSQEFKLNAVRMITDEDRSGAEVARDLGVSTNMLYNWKRKYLEEREEAFPGNGKLKTKDEYIRKLEQENKRLQQERDILKKATAFFAREQ